MNNEEFIENADINGDGEITVSDVTALVNIILDGGCNIKNVVVNGADGITFGGGGNGPVKASENLLWK